MSNPEKPPFDDDEIKNYEVTKVKSDHPLVREVYKFLIASTIKVEAMGLAKEVMISLGYDPDDTKMSTMIAADIAVEKLFEVLIHFIYQDIPRYQQITVEERLTHYLELAMEKARKNAEKDEKPKFLS